MPAYQQHMIAQTRTIKRLVGSKKFMLCNLLDNLNNNDYHYYMDFMQAYLIKGIDLKAV